VEPFRLGEGENKMPKRKTRHERWETLRATILEPAAKHRQEFLEGFTAAAPRGRMTSATATVSAPAQEGVR
jgi:hypothetical protein